MAKAASSGCAADALKIIFDLDQVDYVVSAFLRLCLVVAKSVKERNISIINTEPGLMKIFKITGLDQILKVS